MKCDWLACFADLLLGNVINPYRAARLLAFQISLAAKILPQFFERCV